MANISGTESRRPTAQAASPEAFVVTHRRVLAITLPMTLAFLTTPLLGLTGTAVVGHIGDAVALAGLAVGAVVFDFAFAPFNFIRTGTTGLTAQALGAGDVGECQAIFWRAAILAVLIGLALLAAEPLIVRAGVLAVDPGPAVASVMADYVFVRLFSAPFALMNYAVLGTVLGAGQARLGLVLQLVINGVNIALSILFGVVLGGGIKGVALGSVGGEAIGAIVGVVVTLRGFDAAKTPSRATILDRAGFARMMALNRDIMIRSFSLLVAYVGFARLGAQFGAVTLAANGVLLNMLLVGGYFLDGVATASEQLVGHAVGARLRSAFDRAVRLTVLWGLGLSGALTLIFLVGGTAAVAFLANDPAVRAAAAPYTAYAAVAPFAGALAFIMDGVYIGATWSRTMRDMMLLSLGTFFAAAALLVPAFGNHGLWLALLIFLSMRGLSLAAMLPARRRSIFPTC